MCPEAGLNAGDIIRMDQLPPVRLDPALAGGIETHNVEPALGELDLVSRRVEVPEPIVRSNGDQRIALSQAFDLLA